jgi:ribose-phosphate pyrophosphokinase
MDRDDLEQIVSALVSDPRFMDVLLSNESFLEEVARRISPQAHDFTIFSYRDVLIEETVDGEKRLVKPYSDPLATEICEGLSSHFNRTIKPGRMIFDRFGDRTSLFTADENIRRKDIYVLFNPDPQKDPDGELLRFNMFLKTLRSAHARNITAVIPELLYSRQDQTNGKRQIVAARYIADIFDFSGMDHLITIGLHAPQIEGFYSSIDHLKTRGVFSDYLQREALERIKGIARSEGVVEIGAEFEDGTKFYREHARLISPDAGGMKGVNELRRDMDPDRLIDVGFVQKERVGMNQAESGKVVGDVKGKVVVIYDDMLDTGGSLFGAAKALKEAGALYVIACVDHFLGNNKSGEVCFEEKLKNSYIDELVITNTVPGAYERVTSDDRLKKKTTVLSIAPLLKEAILRDQSGGTIREMVTQVGKESLYTVLHQKAA